jgi:hypothetical protein
VSGGTTKDGFQVSGQLPGGGKGARTSNAASLKQRVWDCGAPVPTGHVLINAGDVCGQVHDECAGDPTINALDQPVTTLATQTRDAHGTWSALSVNCTVAAGPPLVPAAAARATFIRLLPKLAITTAPPDGRSLVNAESLFWIPVSSPLNLGITTLLGHQVSLTATVVSVGWDFGDGDTATSAGPGRPFLASDHCNTPLCPAWFGHVYTHPTTQLTVTATISWTGSYTIDNGVVFPIQGAVTTTPPAIAMQVVQARSVLVPNPTPTN